MQAGQLTHKAIIQFNSNDGTTDPLPTDWQTVCEVWAAKKGLTGRLFFEAAAAQAENEVILTIRYRSGINPTMHIVLDGDGERPYKITSEPVDVADARQWLELHARRIDTNGG